MKVLRKLFGGINLTWPKVIIAAVIAGVLTGVIALIPALHYTSFHSITTTFEAWVLFGLIIILNSKSNLDAGLKAFVFFLISQPLVYLVQVPFSSLGWQLFNYYPYWLVWTVLCFPMGFVGYYMKKGKWWGYLILLPLIILTGFSYYNYFQDFLFNIPRYILVCLFCACAMIVYPLAIFEDKRIRTVGAAIGGVAVIALTVICLLRPPVYSTEIMGSSEEHEFDATYTVFLADGKYGNVEIVYLESLENYMVHADFTRRGDTVLIMVSPSGEKTEYAIHIERDTFEVTKLAPGGAGQ